METRWAREGLWHEAERRTHHLGLVGPDVEFEVHCKYKGKQWVLSSGVTGFDLYLKDFQVTVWRMNCTGVIVKETNQ